MPRAVRWVLGGLGARVSEIRDVWMDAFRLRGAAEVGASITVGSGDDKMVSIRSADLRYRRGTFLSAGETSLRDLALRVRGRVEPFSTKRTRGKALLGLISARGELDAVGPGDVLLNQYFGKAGWLAFSSGLRHVTAQVEVERGHVRAGSHVDLDQAPPIMKGGGLRIDARSPADLLQFPPDDFGGRIALGRAEFPDLTFVNEFLPGGAGLVVRGGWGTVHGDFETGEGAACQGRLTVTTTGLVVDAGGVENAGNVALTVEVPRGNLRDRTFGLDQTRIELTDFAFTSQSPADHAPDWQGEIAVTEGNLDLGPTLGAEVRLELGFSDTRPLVAFLSQKKPLKDWEERMLTFGKLTGESVAGLATGTTTIRHFGLRAGKVDVRFRATIDSRGAFGKARARYGLLKAGIGLLGQDRDLKVTRVGDWYKKDDIPGMPPLFPEFEEIGAR